VLFTGSQRTRVASGAMYQTALIEAAGGSSVTANLSGYWNDVGVEQVLVWDPEWILVPPYGGASVAAVLEDAEWGLMDAVRAERVVRMPKLVAPWDTPTPDSVLAVVWLAEVLHPGAELACADEVAFFYPRFYDYPISDDEVAELCGL
jgi:iron complex transport system substrate-binding protein